MQWCLLIYQNFHSLTSAELNPWLSYEVAFVKELMLQPVLIFAVEIVL